jgi:hypothetical protein
MIDRHHRMVWKQGAFLNVGRGYVQFRVPLYPRPGKGNPIPIALISIVI